MAESTKSFNSDNNQINFTYNDVAKKLLKDRLLLTALELHTELLDSGKEVRQLKDFFSNPGNFELHTQEYTSRISRSGSQTTLDSLDFTRYSEDGERGGDERVAVLEFELRKAKETISALRNNLTVATESEKNSPDKQSIKCLNSDGIKPHEKRALNFLINEYLLLHGYKLTSITFSDENEDQDFEDWDDVGLNIAKPSELLTLYREGLKQTGHNLISAFSQTEYTLKEEEYQESIKNFKQEIELFQTKLDNLYSENEKLYKQLETSQKQPSVSSKNSIGSNSPEHFEIIDKSNLKQEDNLIEDDLSNNSSNPCDWTQVSINVNDDNPKEPCKENFTKMNLIQKRLSMKYEKELYNLCPIHSAINVENEALESVLKEVPSLDSIVNVISESMLKIIPNIILNKREEAIPLLICAVHLNPNSTVRDKLLQQLFNLKKKPLDIERSSILAGISAIAKYTKETVVENELLPQCWEQLTHKHVERRLLVVESCRVLISHVSGPIRNSLMLSMLQQMMDDREEIVRKEVVCVLALVVAFCDDLDKYSQCEDLAFATLKDTSCNVIDSSIKILFPVLAKWALDIGRLKSDLIKNLLHKLNNTLKMLKNESPSKAIPSPEMALKLIQVINELLPFILMFVTDNEIVLDRVETGMKIDLTPELSSVCSSVTNPAIFYDSEVDVGMILYEFDKLIGEDDDCKWDELEWITNIVFPDLLNSLNHIDITQHDLLQAFIALFSNFCKTFGKAFSSKRIRPLFQTHVQNLEQILSSFNQYSPSLNIIPVYLVSVLSFCDPESAGNVLRRFLCALPLCGTPLDCLEISVRGLCELGLQEIVVQSLWEGVVHQKPLVRGFTAGLFATIISLCNETLLNSKVTPALVTLANDSDALVRTATIPALGALIIDCSMTELHDKSYMQLQMFLSDPATKENHSLLRQLVVTMGNIVIGCKPAFRQDVILPQLTSISIYMFQTPSQSRKVDMAVALIEAFSNVTYSPLNNNAISNLVLPGLRYLEQAVTENQALMPHREAVITMIKECENRVDLTSPQTPTDKGSKISQNVNQGVEEMKQRVSKIFNKPPSGKQASLPNLQSLFKKK
ncbi:PREDICTED: lisH domain and HEAT repeat-containing protein KIAA1468 homolog isoform X1 [Nicrophorus vespilloides]|uniref:LisH domain and HEAT repeat-containing protein KIAA1468 homolog isoform X1 n=1 Tax=Nicrophorus vespilloides TaxID=110193 RepID=A0ABM1N2S8_NICVS|nr:PREDICTED: lisH domain and HEAT repeat-containing protein KIAA1468 homolog isoform X1 [Nicrophorus vespilloides]